MADAAEREEEAAGLEHEIAEVCGLLNATTGRLVGLIASVLTTESWQGWRIHSPEQWVAWKCGVSPARARSLVRMARRLGEFPVTKAALEAGELSEDQVAVVCRRAPASIDADVAELARSATVTQLQRVLSEYSFETPMRPAPPEPPEEPRRVSFGYTDNGSWRLSALLPADESALVERALTEAREELFRSGEHDAGPRPDAADVSWADALVAVAERSLRAGADGAKANPDRCTVLLHVNPGIGGHLHLGPGMPDGLRRYLSCDSRVRTVLGEGGRAVSVGRAFRTVPARTRIVIEERDRGCRVPGCARTRWLHVHHLVHWEDGGATDTTNLVALCSHHHRLHHLGRLGIEGDADDPDGLEFTDERGRLIPASGRPRPPAELHDDVAARLAIQPRRWAHPTGESLDPRWIHFHERPTG